MSGDSMTSLVRLAEAGDVEGVLKALAALTPQERAAQAGALEERRARIRAGWGACSDEMRNAQIAAELGCLTDPAAAADCLLQGANVWALSTRSIPWLLDVVNLRPVAWRAELVTRLAERLRPEETVRFDFLEHLLYDAGCPVPATDGFIASWLSWRRRSTAPPLRLRDGFLPGDSFLERLRADALTPVLLPLALDRPAVPLGLVEVFHSVLKRHGLRHVLENTNFGVFILLSTEDEGLVDRAALIRRFFAAHLAADRVWWPDAAVALTSLALTPEEHASVSRERLLLAEPMIASLLQDSTHPLTFLQALALTPAENAPLLRDHVAMLDLSSQVAAYGQEVLTGLDEAGLLEDDVLTEVCERVLLRPEKKLVRAQLAWLDRAAKRDATRAGRVVAGAALAFQHSDVGLQERALKLVARHLPAVADEQVLSGLREAAVFLTPALTARAGELFGPPGQDTGGPSAGPSAGPSDEVPPDFLPEAPEPEPVHPIASAAEVAPEVAVLLADSENVVAFERALDGLVRHARLDRGTLSKALGPVMRNRPGFDCWCCGADPTQLDLYDVATAVRGDEPRDWHIHRRRELLEARRADRRTSEPGALLGARLIEAIELIESGAQPYLLALPTRADGAVDAAALVERIAEFESLGVTPAPIDLAQALLRVTPTDDARVREAAGALRSDAGRSLTRWLHRGGAPHWDTTPDRWPAGDPAGAAPGRWAPATPRTGHDLPLPPVAAALLGPYGWNHPRPGVFMLAQLPHHRDEVAACFGERTNRLLLPRLMEANGTAGYATHWQITRRLGDPKEADAAVDALLVLAAQGQLDARLLAGQWQALTRYGASKPSRVTAALRAAAETGAWATVWSVLEAALPALLRGTPVNGAGALLALAVECAARSGARGSVPEVDELASRKGSSQTVKNARLLRDVLRG
ncbi:DUF6493 family protein [Streptomyces sp. MA15]|uniref:DUF7824 domain-containing protein n=1 Tax=Streptomyces sp. MA15 TaxID=3055061 RepID=UPI0025B03B6B|nr:DUF6493 family protein [Streptomyces sp. MA15]MDN3271586.1 DUF6493 family protein [Streptomyces sp. MA15]